jgi:tRNA(fMet)-specific endonuclease VapC
VGRRLILDTNVLIAYERGKIDRAALDADELAIAAVTVAEYRVGIELADTPARAADRARALVAITSTVEVLDYTEATAACHARLIAHVRRAGTPRGARRDWHRSRLRPEPTGNRRRLMRCTGP